ncbi:MAG: RES family NAD+ phosphorylase [Thiobacillus sp.]
MPFAVASRLAPVQDSFWRAVEAQHKVSTMRLVGNVLDDQLLLEAILEQSKPPLPPPAQGLHWLLFTPFRYPPHAGGSRFRAPGDPGVFYAAHQRRTACAESGYWRWRFVQASAGLSSLESHPMSLFLSRVRAQAVDLRQPSFKARRKDWTHANDYSVTQRLARDARAQGAQVILYESVRDPERGGCAAVLTPDAFVPGQEPDTETWFLAVTPKGVVWQRPSGEHFEFAWEA